ncbi:MAG TPA: bifunctional [glutamate--ammonia ligase]-adenylyl-L-tyrosine phosphorylase/[glutamate--ammonia-ligase] adenylyltransferase [Burkholderiales bacterium]|nr:bifunctional [glutamate--ammonia ligase]-adenylyl-L-tyrosine phosphorylase/[glutamate--ammonia-ligase] adenylyltransferase [Burkholderiales bacterium]
MHSSHSEPASAPIDPAALLERAAGLSHFVRRLLGRRPVLFDAATLATPCDRAHIRKLLADESLPDEAALLQRLREVRQAAMLQIICRDLNGLAGLDEVMLCVTALAEESLRFALRHLQPWMQAMHGTPRGHLDGAEQHLVVVGMGKLGGEELNVSSDIDLVFLYPQDGATDAHKPMANQEYFTRLSRRLINAIAEYTADGHVFRVDMRLRPYGDSGPLAMSYDMLENYLQTQGREWERYAWVKGRVVSATAEPELDALVTPFVYRRYLDFGAIASLRELHAQIRAEVERSELHDNIKLGPGGIREIEFIAQVFQIVRGGRDSSLRLRPTQAALRRLAELRLLPVEAAADLRSAYVFLRNLEHRLQYLDDQQTQSLPANDEDRALIARAMGLPDHSALLARLDTHRDAVTRQFEAVFAGSATPGRTHPLSGVWLGTVSAEEGVGALTQLGYANPEGILARLTLLRESQAYRRMAASTQARLDQLAPRAIVTAAAFDHPDQTLERLARVIESIGRREAYFSLLLEYPAALEHLAALAAASPWAADYLAQHPMLLDELISAQAFEPPDWERLRVQLATELDQHSGNTERQMDALRHFKQTQTLRLLAQDLGGTLPLETLSDHLSDLARVILGQVLRLAWAGLRTRHRDEPHFAVIGYGKLGGKELGYASDLDLIFLYDDDHVDAQDNYARLAQRVNTWLTSFTPAGVLYETDLRLRPDGASGLLVSQFPAYAEYQRSKAWTFEHQALTRARFEAGDTEIGARFEQLRVDVLRKRRDLSQLKSEVLTMRVKMLDGHPNRSGLFDLKHDRGGIVDVEFAVQYLVLGYSYRHEELTGNIGNLALLMLAARLTLIPEAVAREAHRSYHEFRRLQHQIRLQGETYARLPREKIEDRIAAVLRLWQEVFGED